MGRRKALLIGINYTGSQHALQGCQQDVRNMIPFLQSRGFTTDPQSMVILADDRHEPHFWPTGFNILNAMDWLVSEPDCSLFLHYSGHGGQQPDDTGDRDSGYDDTICPVDFEANGQIGSDILHRRLVSALAPGCQLHVLFDCCHSGSAIELPFVYRTDEDGNVNLLNNVKQGLRLAETARELAEGDFSFQKISQAKQLVAGAQSLFNSLKYRKPDENGLGQQHFSEDWKSENKRVFFYSGCRDDQTSADAAIGGNHVGAMSWAFLETMKWSANQTYIQILQNTRRLLSERYSQVPQLSIGYQMNLNVPLML